MKSFTSAVLISLMGAMVISPVSSDNKKRCMDTPRHFPEPRGETGLSKTCHVYDGNACCKAETTVRIHGNDLYNFSKFLCKSQDLSPSCKNYFLMDACFYECSPDLGPFIAKNETTKSEYLSKVPLCREDCESWFSACANDFTCAKDWKEANQNESFSCKKDSKCQTVKDKFHTAEDFCEKVWGGSYKVSSDENSCLKIKLPEKKDKSDSKSGNADEANSSSSVKYNIIVVSIPLLATPIIYFMQSLAA